MDDLSAFGVIHKRQFSTQRRIKLAEKNKAMPDGSFPIVNASDLANARRAIGRTTPDKRPAVQAHIERRAKELGL